MVSTIALYGSPASSVCSTPHSCQINGHASHDLELGSRSSSSSSSNTASTSQKPVVMGGLSCLFSSPTVKHASLSSFSENIISERGEEFKELSSSFSYSSSKLPGSSWKKDQSPISVFQGPISCSSSSSSVVVGGDVNYESSIRSGTSGLFDGFVRNALGSCLDYDPPSFEVSHGGDLEDELTFDLEGAFVEGSVEPYARELLLGAQLRHKIFHEEVVIKAFYEAEQAHRGQVYRSIFYICNIGFVVLMMPI